MKSGSDHQFWKEFHCWPRIKLLQHLTAMSEKISKMGTFEVSVVLIHSLKKHSTGAVLLLGLIWFGFIHRG